MSMNGIIMMIVIVTVVWGGTGMFVAKAMKNDNK